MLQWILKTLWLGPSAECTPHYRYVLKGELSSSLPWLPSPPLVPCRSTSPHIRGKSSSIIPQWVSLPDGRLRKVTLVEQPTTPATVNLPQGHKWNSLSLSFTIEIPLTLSNHVWTRSEWCDSNPHSSGV